MNEKATFLQVDLLSFSDQKIDFEKLWAHFNGRETEFLTKAIVYSCKNPEVDSGRFELKLQALGFETKFKPIERSRNYCGIIPPNNDISMVIDCISMAPLFAKWVFIANNSSLVEVGKYLKNAGKQVEIWCSTNNYNPVMEPYADKLCFVDEQFCFKKQRISIFGTNYKSEHIFDSTSV